MSVADKIKIYLEPSGYRMLNVGDAAMQIIATERLKEIFPNSRIFAVTEDATRLEFFTPNVLPISAHSRRMFFSEKVFGSRVNAMLPNVVSENLKKLSPLVRRNYPNSFNRVSKKNSPENDFWTTLKNADLVVVSGAGAINDAFANHALTILETLDLAIRQKIPTAMLGQGIGPISDSRLLKKAREVFPKVDFISLRESRKGLGLLTECGVSRDRIEITGDDAIELAFDRRQEKIGEFIGINLRVADYSSVAATEIESFGKSLKEAAKHFETELLPIPISFQSGERSDNSVLNSLLGTEENLYPTDKEKTPQFVISQIGRCRLVVTGSYHGAVFALSQGIPVVCVAKSEYYFDKFYGLAEQFGAGCRVVSLAGSENSTELLSNVKITWEEAPDIREILLKKAAEQIRGGRFAYRKLAETMRLKNLSV